MITDKLKESRGLAMSARPTTQHDMTLSNASDVEADVQKNREELARETIHFLKMTVTNSKTIDATRKRLIKEWQLFLLKEIKLWPK